eukprot:gnl/TRDRNA2_/TRDRNA2_163891_c3_seq1.p1 gnl/TRDRNA2_/TRDRNA2_163891_c3~~gnl/TRDRNA2_/TRDRNA2_163891_c3_seq1.p1  ORF type:complete len:182 (+),score=47.09 gnl/TRDRNA2_/TRDRNA2_163891_c3_seq1:41-547(+)
MAGLDPSIVVNKDGKVMDASWNGAQIMMGKTPPGKPKRYDLDFLVHLSKLPDEIDAGRVPKKNIEAARKIKNSLGEEWSFDFMVRVATGAAALCQCVNSIIAYYDLVNDVIADENAKGGPSLNDKADTQKVSKTVAEWESEAKAKAPNVQAKAKAKAKASNVRNACRS